MGYNRRPPAHCEKARPSEGVCEGVRIGDTSRRGNPNYRLRGCFGILINSWAVRGSKASTSRHLVCSIVSRGGAWIHTVQQRTGRLGGQWHGKERLSLEPKNDLQTWVYMCRKGRMKSRTKAMVGSIAAVIEMSF